MLFSAIATGIAMMVAAVVVGYLCGKRKGMSIVAMKKSCNSNVPSMPVLLNGTESYEELLDQEKPFIQKYDMVTVLFADIKGFTEITESIEPESLLDNLNSFFFHFDTLIDRYRIEKIKTMGDAYMCAGGIPQKNRTNPIDVVMVALDMQNHLNRISAQNPDAWSVRIGIHTGQVIAGMLGYKKLSFDIWGHTVNLASRLETSCKPGRVNISGVTYEKIERYFDCEYHGLASHTGDVSYYVNRLKPEFTDIDANGQPVPNHAFYIQMQLLRLGDLAEYVESMMTDAAMNLFFHNFQHVHDVCEQVEKIAVTENLADEDLLLLKTAALLHDIGYSISYHDDMHTLSDDMARETLPLFQYNRQQIERICHLMKATHIETSPESIMDCIMHDANLMYIGHADFVSRTMRLFYEQKKHQTPIDRSQWINNRIDLLKRHRFYTQAARNAAKIPIQQQIDALLHHSLNLTMNEMMKQNN